jgi:hypothetical protein
VETEDRGISLYHVVYAREGFGVAAQALFELVRSAQEKYPDKPRLLFLDIDGHRNNEGGFDPDMYELQKEFLLGFLGKYLTEISCPLVRIKNNKPQDNDVPESLAIDEQPKV